MKQTENSDTATPEVASEISPGVEERVQVTAFIDDQAVIPEHVPGETILSDMGTLQYADSMRHSIISFLERPQLISCFAWKGMSTDMHGQDILCLQDPLNPNSLITNPRVPSQVMTKMFIEKLQGFTAFRATAVFKLQINSQNFQAGRLIFGAVPMPTLLGERADFIVKSPCSALSVNHVQMDINKQTEVILRVPFISPFNSYDLINQQYDWAGLFCIVYGPLNVVGDDNTLQCDLYCHFEDIELGCPTTAECTITPCVAPTRVTYWKEAAKAQSGTVENMTTLRDILRQEKIEKQKRRQQQVEANIRNQLNLPKSQSGRVNTKGKLYKAGWTEQPEGEIEPELIGEYWLDLWMASDVSRKVLVTFNRELETFSVPGIDNIIIFSGPYNFKDKVTYTNNTTQLIWQIFDLEQIDAAKGTICTDPNCTIRPPTPEQIVPENNQNEAPATTTEIPEVVVNGVINENESFQNEQFHDPPPWPGFLDSEMGFPRSQSGRGSSNGRPQRSNGSQANKQVKQSRAPPKEAAPQKVEKMRVEESDGLFASRSRALARGVGNVATAVGDVAATVFNWLGWSKPQISHSGDTVVIRPTQYFSNTNGIDHSHVLSLDLLNNVDSYPGLAGTDLDELSLDYIKRIPQFIGAFQFNNKNTISPSSTGIGNDYLWSCFVLPNYINPACMKIQYDGVFGDDNVTANNTLYIENPTSLGYICAPFAYWTGSLVYTFRFVKTNYNSGRIEISFHPFFYAKDYPSGQNVPAPDNQRFQYAYKLVVDLHENSEISFTVPYISPQQWKALGYYSQKHFINPCKDPSAWTDNQLNEMARCSTGLLWVRALTPLHTQSAVAPTSVLCLVECRAGDDFRLQCPSTNRYIPFATTPNSQSGRVYATSGTEDTRTRALEGFIPESITGDNSDIEREDTQKLCAGEIFSNFRQYIKRNMFIRSIYQSSNYLGVSIFPNELIIPPRLQLNIYKYGTNYFQIFVLPYWPSPLSYVSAMYCFYRGGVRIKVTTTDRSGNIASGLTSARLIVNPYTGVPSEITPTTNTPNQIHTFSSPIHYEQSDKTIGEFQIPYYSPTIQSVPWTIHGGYLFDNPLPYVKLNASQTSSIQSRTPSQFHIASSASDDFDLGYFLGAPLCLRVTSWNQAKEYTSGKTFPLFSQSNPADTIYDADPCYFVPPYHNGQVPTGQGELVQISTTNLYVSLANVYVSNPTLTVTNDPSLTFKIGCNHIP